MGDNTVADLSRKVEAMAQPFSGDQESPSGKRDAARKGVQAAAANTETPSSKVQLSSVLLWSPLAGIWLSRLCAFCAADVARKALLPLRNSAVAHLAECVPVVVA
jgi:hypothetical protein